MKDFNSVEKKTLVVNELENARKSINIAFLLYKRKKKTSNDLLKLCDHIDDILSYILDSK
jgi:hypothetical protein